MHAARDAKRLIRRSLRAKASVVCPYSFRLRRGFALLGFFGEPLHGAEVYEPSRVGPFAWRVVLIDGPAATFAERALAFDTAAREG